MMSLSEWLDANQYKFDLLETSYSSGEDGWVSYEEVNQSGLESLINVYLASLKVWVYSPRSAEPEVHLRIETVLEDMAVDIEVAEQEGEQWDFRDDVYPSIYVDDGGSARLVAIRP